MDNLDSKIIEKKIEEYEERERPSDEFPAEPFSEHLVGVRVRGRREGVLVLLASTYTTYSCDVQRRPPAALTGEPVNALSTAKPRPFDPDGCCRLPLL